MKVRGGAESVSHFPLLCSPTLKISKTNVSFLKGKNKPMGTKEEKDLLEAEFEYILSLYEDDEDPFPHLMKAINMGKAPTCAAFIRRNQDSKDMQDQIVAALRDIRQTGDG